ncbi:hypothetical protein B9Z55_004853 [Caenorhabditis nigoni]|uniref:Dual specificity phosphatase catalytic domain-containing protein n=1 Tax=Caenorhabditis nigoni TaxID=1611254 RepID=A0A2G5UYD2_9PELO|nr:hypothetical protein B9Z55_004853 [Caenorhabditis nigoni]
MLTSLVFYPSLGYNLFRNYVQGSRWAWYNRVDDTLILGAMPFQSMKNELIGKENVGGVVCCTEEFELKAALNAMREEDWRKEGVEFFAVPMKDFTGSAPRAEIDGAVQFIESVAAKGKTVYVHCKVSQKIFSYSNPKIRFLDFYFTATSTVIQKHRDSSRLLKTCPRHRRT